MSIANFDVKEQYLGTGLLSDYSFDWKIGATSELLIIKLDDTDVEVDRFRGDDTDFVTSVDFDAVEGGGTISLVDPVENNYTLIILLANDAPTQPFEFRDKRSFTLRLFESALDWITGALQRVSWLSTRSIRLNDADEGANFDPQLPLGLEANRVLMISPDGNSLVQGPTPDELAQASSDADDAAASAAAAAISQTAASASATAAAASATTASAAQTAASASAVAAAASAAAAALSAASFTGFIHTGPFAAIAPNANADLAAEIIDHTVSTQVDYTARVVRGTTVFARVQFSIFYRNGAWESNDQETRRADASAATGVTFTVKASGQINAAVANDGGSNAIIDLQKLRWAV